MCIQILDTQQIYTSGKINTYIYITSVLFVAIVDINSTEAAILLAPSNQKVITEREQLFRWAALSHFSHHAKKRRIWRVPFSSTRKIATIIGTITSWRGRHYRVSGPTITFRVFEVPLNEPERSDDLETTQKYHLVYLLYVWKFCVMVTERNLTTAKGHPLLVSR